MIMTTYTQQELISMALNQATDVQTTLSLLQVHLKGDRQRQAVETIMKLQELVEFIGPLEDTQT